MALPDFSMRQLLEAGAHFGHQTHRWNPKMERYIFGSRSNIHIIDLSQTIPLLHQALVKVREVAASGGRVTGVRERIAEAAVAPIGLQIGLLHQVLGIVAVARQPAGQIVGGAEVRHDDALETLQLLRLSHQSFLLHDQRR